MHQLSIDIETYSSVDIKSGGAYKYALSPDFEVLLLAYSLDGGAVQSITGNTCKRGAEYAAKEVTHPTRIVTTSVAVTGSKTGAYTVSCKTASDIPKEKIFAVIDALRSLTVPAPVRIGDVLLPDAAGTGVPIIATKHVD